MLPVTFLIYEVRFSHSVVSDSCDPMDCSPPASSVHGILQARILQWVTMPSNPGLPHCQRILYHLSHQGSPLLGIYPKKLKALIQKDTYTPVLIETLFTTAEIWKQPKCPSTDERMRKMWYMYTMECYSAIKKNKMLPLAATWMNLEGIMLK